MFTTDGGLGGTEGTVRPGVFPRMVSFGGFVGDDVTIEFDERGMVGVTFEWVSNLCEYLGWPFVDLGYISREQAEGQIEYV